jgi:type I restriction enzyme S subunit
LDKTKVDSAYVATFLRTYAGQRLIEKGVYGSTGQLNLSSDHIKRLPIPTPDIKAQNYVGNKIRYAFQLEVRAKKLEKQFFDALKTEFIEAFNDKSTGRKHSRALASEIGYTLNPGAFNEERLRVQRYLLSKGGVKLGHVAQILGGTTKNYNNESIYIGLDSIDSDNCKLTPSNIADAEIKGSSRTLIEGPVVAKLRPYLNKVSYIPKRLSGAVGSTELLCIKPKGELSPWYLYGVLKSEAILKQLRPLATGATHPRIDQYDLSDLVIPVLTNATFLGNLLKHAQEAYFESASLTKAAKQLSEALYSGYLKEIKLVEAQQLLDEGDDKKDREILSKLTDKGYLAEDGKPLFTDLDKLYELLDKAKTEVDEESV